MNKGFTMTAVKEEVEEKDTVHDFNEEHKIILVLGGFVIIKEPILTKILNLALIICVFLVYVFLILMAIITLHLKSQDKVVVVKIVQALCVLTFAILMPAARYRSQGKLESAVDSLKSGIYKYEEEENYSKIKKYRVSQIRNLESLLIKICFGCALMNTILLPLKNILFRNEDNTDNILNPYLPLPIYMPFNTKNIPNFIVAFLMNATFNFFLFFATLFSTLKTYTSCALQLIAQIEILIDSLINIEKRARSKLAKNGLMRTGEPLDLFEVAEFQRCLCSCLKENIIHHHAILRFTKETGPYMEALNFLGVAFFSIILAASVMAMTENAGFNLEVVGTLILDVCCFFLMCWLGQFIQDKSSQIRTFLYSTPWPHCNKNFKILLKIMIMNTQYPISLKTPLFNMDMSLATFGDGASVGYKITTLLR